MGPKMVTLLFRGHGEKIIITGMLLFILEWIIWFLSVLPVGVLQAWPGLVKGQVWPLHPIRLWLISLFFRVEERDEKRHWTWCNPLPPPVFPPPGYPSTCCGFVCGFGRALAFSKKPAVTTHFSTMHTHTRAGIKGGKVVCHRVLLLSGWKCHRNRVWAMKGH